jgi:hypothetical protein
MMYYLCIKQQLCHQDIKQSIYCYCCSHVVLQDTTWALDVQEITVGAAPAL